jgi:hypothetical protein
MTKKFHKHLFWVCVLMFMVMVVVYIVGLKNGERRHRENLQKLRFHHLMFGLVYLDDMQAGDIDAAEQKIRISCCVGANILLEDEQWKNDHSLFDEVAQSLWKNLKETPSENWCPSENKFNELMKKNSGCQPN